MLWALCRKQFLQINRNYFMDLKTGKRRSIAGIIGYILLFAFVFFSVGMALFFMAGTLVEALIPVKLDWLYFLMMTVVSVLLGTFGSVFSTYSSLYFSGDNEMLLAMPIPPRDIVLVRLGGVYLMSLLYEAIVMIPAFLAYWMKVPLTVGRLLSAMVFILLINFFIVTLTSILGYGVARLTARLKNRSFYTVLFSLLFLGAYYFFYFRFNVLLNKLLENVDRLAGAVQKAPLLVQIGMAGTGDGVSLAVAAVLCLIPAGVVFAVLSHSFVRIVTQKPGEERTGTRNLAWQANSVQKTLLNREKTRFFSSSTYMLNCGLGLLLLPVIGVVSIVKSSAIQEMVLTAGSMLPQIHTLLSIGAAAVVCLLNTMNPISTPSVSLEGKNLWVLKTLPVEPKEVLRAKLKWHILLCLPCTMLCGILLSIGLRLTAADALCVLLAALLFVPMYAAVGLIVGLKHPNLTWTNEVVPIKQNMSVLMIILLGWAISAAMFGLGFVLSRFMAGWQILLIYAALFAGLMWLLIGWLENKGTRLFAEL